MSKEKRRVEMLLVILTESDGTGVVPGGPLCSAWWSEWHWAGPGRGTREPAAAAQTVPLPPPAPGPSASAGTFGWAPWEGEGSPWPAWAAGRLWHL